MFGPRLVILSRLPRDGLIGRVLRLPLHLVPRNMHLPVLQGPMRGQRWIVGAGTHGCWLGTYEYEKAKRVAAALQPGQVVLDIGAHAGFYTLLAARIVGPAGRVFAFEPLPDNAAYIRRHLALNQVDNVTVIEAAVLDRLGTVALTESESRYENRVSDRGIAVAALSIDELMRTGRVPSANLVKIDVEGVEELVLRGMSRFLLAHQPGIFLATHGRRQSEGCRAVLEAAGYRMEPLESRPPEETDEWWCSPRPRS